MTFFPDVLPELESDETGWTLESADKIWLIASVDTYSEEDSPYLGEPVFLGQHKDEYCWYYEFDDQVFAFTSHSEAKGELALADTKTTIYLFELSLGDYLRFEAAVADQTTRVAEMFDSFTHPGSSIPFFTYLMNRDRWKTNKRG